MACSTLLQILVEQGCRGTHKWPRVIANGENTRLLDQACGTARFLQSGARLGNDPAAAFAKPAHGFIARKREIAHQPLDHPGAGVIFRAQCEPANRCKIAALDSPFILRAGRSVLGIALWQARYR